MTFTDTIKRLLPNDRFARSVSILAGGTIAGQAVVVLASPLLTRLYSPEDFGLLGVYAALLLTIGVVASLRYQLAIPLPADDQEAAAVAVVSLLVVLSMTLLTAIVVLFFRHPIADALNIPALARYLWLLPAGLLLLGIYQVFNSWAIRTKAFPAIARTKLTQSLSMIGVQIGGSTLGPLALLLGQIAGQAVGSITLGELAIRKQWTVFRAVRIAEVRKAAGRYRQFPIYSTWGGVFNTAGTQLPPLLFATMFGPAAAGLYILAHRILAMPMALIGQAITEVFFSRAADAQRNGTLAPLVTQIHKRLAQIAMPPTLFLFITGPEIFQVAFGENWAPSGGVARWLAPMLYIQFIVSPLSRVFVVLEQQAFGTLLQGILLVSRLGAIAAGWQVGDFMFAVSLYSLASVLCYSLYLMVIEKNLCGKALFSVWLPTIKMIPVSFILVSPLLTVVFFEDNEAWFVTASAVTAALTLSFYGILFWHHGRAAA